MVDVAFGTKNPDKSTARIHPLVGGKLEIQDYQDPREKGGFCKILHGFFGFHRNAKAHEEGYITPLAALQIIGYIDYLLGVIDRAVENENAQIIRTESKKKRGRPD